MTQKIVINADYGGFSITQEAEDLYCAYAGIPEAERGAFYNQGIERDDPILIRVLEQLGVMECSGDHAALRIVEIPDDVKWTIEEYDGKEWVAEVHRTWN
jgi:hypothetical protein